MRQYQNFLQHILENGVKKEDRTGTGTISAIVPPSMRFDLSEGFPIATTKEVNFDNIKYELKWFTNGDTNIKYLIDNRVNIWNADAYRWFDETIGTLSKKDFINEIKTNEDFCREYGELGPIYGKQWRKWDTGRTEYLLDNEWPTNVAVDQLAQVVQQIKDVKAGNHKAARRLIVNAWNAGEVMNMALPPCHVMMQFFVVGNKLSLHLYQRSGDAFLGIPYNISSYSLLLSIIANQVGLEPFEFIHTVGDAHIYLNHLDQVYEQLEREHYISPVLIIPDDVTIDNWKPDEVSLYRYQHHPAIKGDLSV